MDAKQVRYAQRSSSGNEWETSFCVRFVGLGEKDQAFQWLKKAYQERYPRMVSLKVDPILEPLHADPRFRTCSGASAFPTESPLQAVS